MLRSVKNTAVICNIGHFDNEIDTQFSREISGIGRRLSLKFIVFRDTSAETQIYKVKLYYSFG